MFAIFGTRQDISAQSKFPRKRSLTIVLVVLMMAESSLFAAPKDGADAKKRAAAVGIGHRAVVTLSDGSKLKGTLLAVDDSGITLNKGKAGIGQYAYSDISQIKRDGMSKATKITIVTVSSGVAVVGIVWLAEALAFCHSCPYGATCTCTY